MWNLFTRFFKCRHLMWIAILCITSAGCKDDFNDSELREQIANLDERLSTLEKLCAQMNTNISSMQTIIDALQQNDYITGITPITEGSTTIGYTITFVKNKPITIYHGKDGEKGEQGDDGITPQFKIENGRWMVSQDNGSTWEDVGQATGDKGEEGIPGVTPDLKIQNGRWIISWDKGITWKDLGQATGDQGQQGNAGITPQFKIELGKWFVSFDNGINWKCLGQATGDKGEAGQDGTTPVIGIKQDTDGFYYWMLNGTWLLDDNNKKIKAEGSAGKDGEDGKPGKDGITPLLNIKDGYWEVSYDNGMTWKTLWQATGPKGEKGENGDSMFSSVDYTSSDEYVIFSLSNGEQLKIPTWYAFEELRKKCNEMNTNISSLQSIITALEENDYVTSVTPLMEEGKAIGYTISFSKSPAIIIYHGKDGQDGTPGQDGKPGKDGAPGKDGNTPIIGIEKDIDGVYYWTLNGNWLLDENNNKIKAQGTDGNDGDDGNDGIPGTPGKDGITPQLKIEDGYWYISYKEGEWQKLGPSSTGGDNAFFENVTEDEDYVHMTLNGGNTISIPKYKPLSITFSETEDIRVLPNKTYSINYTLTGSNSKTVVKALAQDGFRAVVKPTDYIQGVIEITTPAAILNSEVLIFISDGKGHTIMSSINFVEGIINITTKSYTVEYSGGQVEVKLTTNINYSVEIPTEAQSWISLVPKSRAIMREEVIRFNIQPNNTMKERSTIVNLIDQFNITNETILILQRGGTIQSIHVPVAGTLEQLINPADVQLIEKLIISGTLNITDYDFIKTMSNLKTIDLTGITDTEIPSRAFYRSSVTSIQMPQTIKTIGSYAFYASKITSLTIPSSVESIEDYAFCGCGNVTGDLIIPNSVQTLGRSAFRSASFTGSLIIGDGITNIRQQTFARCSSFKGNLTIGKNVTQISDSAFFNCSGFTGNLIIPDEVKRINDYAFYGCSGFKGYLYLGSKVFTIGKDAFVNHHGINIYSGDHTVTRLNFSQIRCNRATPPSVYSNYGNYGVYNSFGCWKEFIQDPSNPIQTAFTLRGTFPEILYVPKDYQSNYRNDYQWKNFKSIYGVGAVKP